MPRKSLPKYINNADNLNGVWLAWLGERNATRLHLPLPPPPQLSLITLNYFIIIPCYSYSIPHKQYHKLSF